MSRFVPSTLVARRFHDLAEAQERIVTPLQLIKLTFLAHGWGYVHLKKRFISENVEAWPYGPVFPELYHNLKFYGGNPVERVPRSVRERFMEGCATNLEELENKLVRSVYETYKDYDGSQLIALTHKTGSPWADTEEGEVIREDKIRDYYIGLAQNG